MSKYPNFQGLMIGIPLTGRPLVPEFTFAFSNLHPPMNYNVQMVALKGHAVDKARNIFAQKAIEEKCKYLFFIDEDVTPPAHAVRQLIYHLEHFEDVAVAAGIYCNKMPPQMPMVFRGNGAGPYWKWKAGEVFDCSGVGMGCAMIRVAAFKDIEPPWFKTVDNVEGIFDGLNKAEMWTEDLYFCDKLTKAGWRILADGGVLPNHWDMDKGVPYNLPPHSYPMQRVGVKTGDKKIVDLGCGELENSYKTEEGEVLRVDIREDVKPDYRADIRSTPFKTGEFDVVMSSHTLEHFSREEVPAVLDEWIRILKPDGQLRLIVPNMKWAAQKILNGEIDGDVMNVLYGAQSYKENFHKMGFVRQMLEQMLNERGLTEQQWDEYGYNMAVKAQRAPVEAGSLQETPVLKMEEPGVLNDGDLSAMSKADLEHRA